MSDLISRADAIKAIRKCKFESVMPSDWYRGMECAQDIIEDVPSADRELAKLKLNFESADAVQGDWEKTKLKDDMWICSACGSPLTTDDISEIHFCPNCGADMRKKENE